MMHQKGHVLALTLASMAAIGALMMAGAQWRLTQSRAATARWHTQAAEVLAQSAIERGIRDIATGQPIATEALDLPPGIATIRQISAQVLHGCGQVKATRICLKASLQDDRPPIVTVIP